MGADFLSMLGAVSHTIRGLCHASRTPVVAFETKNCLALYDEIAEPQECELEQDRSFDRALGLAAHLQKFAVFIDIRLHDPSPAGWATMPDLKGVVILIGNSSHELKMGILPDMEGQPWKWLDWDSEHGATLRHYLKCCTFSQVCLSLSRDAVSFKSVEVDVLEKKG
jgi:hypothetical protein